MNSKPHPPDETVLTDISALLDGELDHERLLEVVDRIADTPDCRAFYRKARALSGLVAATAPVADSTAPLELWHAIARRAGLEDAPPPTTAPENRRTGGLGRRLAEWVSVEWRPLAATAVVLLALAGLTWIGVRDQARPGLLPTVEVGAVGDPDVEAVVELGSDDQMSDDRFLHLATEILEADRHYRRELLRLMTDIESESGEASEGFSEGTSERGSEGPASSDEFGIEPLEDDVDRSRVRLPIW